ncbi:resact receptor-like [Aplysia californica]|uniref:guanylate cyclase n=1 Tax=Aplysia californica TaxID=6500 RepID=A0ABM0K445_APLCA|nr:resact receptor-like [Aplysia californica]
MWERDLTSSSWRVDYDQIKFRHQIANSAKLSGFSLKDSDTTSMVPEASQNFTLVGSYKVRGLRHENLAQFIGACTEPGKVCLLYEYCKKGSLQDVLLTDTLKLDWAFKVALLRDILKGMIYIHQSDLGHHGHLTSANCVVDGKFNVKITDFGLPSFRKPDQCDLYSEEKTFSDIQKLLWVAPEHLGIGEIVGGSKKGDVYSFAIIMEETVTRSVPYDSHRAFVEVEEIIQRVYRRETPPFRPETGDWDVPQAYIMLAERCWAEPAESRPSFENVLKTINTLSG